MADETVTAGEEQATGSPETAKVAEPSIKDILAQMEQIKLAQSGSDKKVKELTTALTAERQEKDKLLKERMSEKEKAQWELEQREKALADKDAELRAKEVALLRASVITEMDVPKELASRLMGNTRDEMVSDAKALIEAMNKAVSVEVNKRLATSGVTPRAGETRPGLTRAQLDSHEDWSAVLAMPPGPEKDKAIADRMAAASKFGSE